MNSPQEVNSARKWVLFSVGLTSTHQSLLKLINVAAATASFALPTFTLIQIVLSCDAEYTLKDTDTAAEKVLAADSDKVIPALGLLDKLQAKTGTTATLTVELFYQ